MPSSTRPDDPPPERAYPARQPGGSRAPAGGAEAVLERATSVGVVHDGDDEASLERAIAERDRAEIVDAELADLLMALASLRIGRGLLDDALPLVERALAVAEELVGRHHPELTPFLNALAHLYYQRRELTRAEPLLRRLVTIKEAQDPDDPEIASVLTSLALVYETAGRMDEARETWRRVLAIRERTLPDDAPAIAVALERLASADLASGDVEESSELLERALGIRIRALGGDHPSVDVIRTRLAELRAGRHPAARASAGTADDTAAAAPRRGGRVLLPGGGPRGGSEFDDEYDVEERDDERDEEEDDDEEDEGPRRRFDPLSDAAWPRTRLVLGASVVVASLVLLVAVTRRGTGEPARPAAAERAPATASGAAAAPGSRRAAPASRGAERAAAPSSSPQLPPPEAAVGSIERAARRQLDSLVRADREDAPSSPRRVRVLTP